MVAAGTRFQTSEWLGDFYGGVPHSVRQIYYGELGWFNADPTTPRTPEHHQESSHRYIDLIGGRDSSDAQPRRMPPTAGRSPVGGGAGQSPRADRPLRNQGARTLKADTLRTLGYGTTNSNWRNFYLTAARELDGTIDYSLRDPDQRHRPDRGDARLGATGEPPNLPASTRKRRRIS